VVIHANAAFVRLTGIDSHLVVGKPISELLIIRMNASERLDDTQQPDEQRHHGDTSFQRARNRGRNEIGLERLVASSGFGQYHEVQVRTKQHHMIGRNVTVVNEGQSTQNLMTAWSDGSIDFDEQVFVQCKASIAPIVSATSSLDYPFGTKTDKDGKRQKNFHHHVSDQSSYRRFLPLQLVTHYVIQLQPLDEACERQDSVDSLSSNSHSIESVEAKLLGLSKDELHRQRAATSLIEEDNQQEVRQDEDISTAESSATKLPVAAVG
jgi:hypothetical protein